jgi:hypothetical protein
LFGKHFCDAADRAPTRRYRRWQALQYAPWTASRKAAWFIDGAKHTLYRAGREIKANTAKIRFAFLRNRN